MIVFTEKDEWPTEWRKSMASGLVEKFPVSAIDVLQDAITRFEMESPRPEGPTRILVGPKWMRPLMDNLPPDFCTTICTEKQRKFLGLTVVETHDGCLAIDGYTGKPLDRPQPLHVLNGGKCDHCGGPTIDRCERCGAPQCCPRCCLESEKAAAIDGGGSEGEW